MSESASTPRLAARISAEGRLRFTGRALEQQAFREALVGGDRRVLLVHGRAGSGKTTLLQEFARIAAEEGHQLLQLTGRDLSCSAEGMAPIPGRLRQLTRWSTTLSTGAGPTPVLLIDDGDAVQERLRTDVLPGLPDSVLVVLATRGEPVTQWRTDTGWMALSQAMPLGWFGEEDGVELLRRCGVSLPEAQRLWAYTEGHPLSLALVSADPSAIRMPALASHHALVLSLLDKLVGVRLDDLQRDALFVCAHSMGTTQEMLREILQTPDVSSTWDWLRSAGPVVDYQFGVRLTPLGRDLVETFEQMHAPSRWRSLHAGIHRYGASRLGGDDGSRSCLLNVRNLFGGHPTSVLSRLWRTSDVIGVWPRRATRGDRSAALRLIEHSVGAELAPVARQWSLEQPQHLFVADISGEVTAAALTVRLTIDHAVACPDPLVQAVTALLSATQAARAHDRFALLRTSIDLDGSTSSDVAVYLGIVAMVSQWLTHRVAFAAVPDPGHGKWGDVLGDLGLSPLPQALPDGRRLHVFDFRRFPQQRWFDYLVEHDMSASAGLPAELLRPTPLTYPQFAQAVKDALRDLHRPHALAVNPLAMCRSADGEDLSRAEALRADIVAACASLGANERDRGLLRVLDASYLRPAASQREAAKTLDLPLGTFRRHLAQALDAVIDLLWAHELAQDSCAATAAPPAE